MNKTTITATIYIDGEKCSLIKGTTRENVNHKVQLYLINTLSGGDDIRIKFMEKTNDR